MLIWMMLLMPNFSTTKTSLFFVEEYIKETRTERQVDAKFISLFLHCIQIIDSSTCNYLFIITRIGEFKMSDE